MCALLICRLRARLSTEEMERSLAELCTDKNSLERLCEQHLLELNKLKKMMSESEAETEKKLSQLQLKIDELMSSKPVHTNGENVS